jgi:hypothetical protein
MGCILAMVEEADKIMVKLEKSGFAPPKKSGVLSYQIGQHVMIAPKSRLKYKVVFKQALKDDPKFLDDLVVADFLTTGEVVVRRGMHLPFMTPKSHLLPGDHSRTNGSH